MDRLDEDELTRAVMALAAGRFESAVETKAPKTVWLNGGSCVRLRPEHRNHVWSYDFVSARTHDGRTLRLLTLLDEVTRECLAIGVERRMGSPAFLARDLRQWLGRLGIGT